MYLLYYNPEITKYVNMNCSKTTYEVMILKDKQGKEIVDKNFFNAMSYELAGEIGILDNEDMKQNIKLISDKNKQEQEKNKE